MLRRKAAVGTLVAFLMTSVADLKADTISQDSGMSTITIASVDPIGQTFQWTADPGPGSIGFTFSNQNPTLPNQPITITLYAGAGFSGTALRSVTQTLPVDLPGPTLPGLPIDFDFSGVTLSPGIYTAAVTTSSVKVGLKYSTINPYADGALLFTPGIIGTFGSGLCTPAGGPCDLQFRVTPVAASETPSIALLLVGLFTIRRPLRHWRMRVISYGCRPRI